MGRGRRRRTCAACSPSRCGTRVRRRCSRRAITWASSRSTTRGTARRSCSAPSSRRCSRIPRVAAAHRSRRAAALSRMPVHSRRRIRCSRSVRKLPPGHTLTLRERALDGAVVLAPGLCGQARAHGRRSRGRARPRAARIGRGHAGRRRAARRVRQRRHRLRPDRRDDDRPDRRSDRHVQHRVRGRRRGQRASRGRARRRAPRQPPPRADAVARPRARRVRPLDRRVRRAVRRPGRAADDAARGLRAARRHRRADRRRRGRGVRRVLELSQARARGALDALARASGVAAARAGEGAAGRRWRKDRLLRSLTEPLARRYRTIPNVFDVLLHPTLFTPQFLAATSAAPDVGDAGGGRIRGSELARTISTVCCTSTPGCGCPTTCSPRSTARR